MNEPLNLDAVRERYDLALARVEAGTEFRDSASLASAEDVPDLIHEIRRLHHLLHPGNHHAGWEAAREALLLEAEGWDERGNLDRSSVLSVAAETLGRLDYRPKEGLGTSDAWRNLARNQIRELRAKDQLIQRLEEASAQDQAEIDRLRAALDHVRLQGHLLLPDDPDRDQQQLQATLDHVRGMVRERDAIIERQDRLLNQDQTTSDLAHATILELNAIIAQDAEGAYWDAFIEDTEGDMDAQLPQP